MEGREKRINKKKKHQEDEKQMKGQYGHPLINVHLTNAFSINVLKPLYTNIRLVH